MKVNKAVLFILLFAVSACTSTINEYTPLTETITTSTSTHISTDEEFCDWFNKSQEIRTKRIPAILIVQDVRDKYDGTPFVFSNTAMINDHKTALKKYISMNEEFIRDWKNMGVFPSAEVYWENELRFVEITTKGYL